MSIYVVCMYVLVCIEVCTVRILCINICMNEFIILYAYVCTNVQYLYICKNVSTYYLQLFQ